MLTLRGTRAATRALPRLFTRANTTAAASSSPTPTPPPPPPAATPAAARSGDASAPASGATAPSPGAPQQWNRPIREGVMPVYDLALRLIEEDSNAIKKEVAEARSEVKALEQELQRMDAAAEGYLAEERQLEDKRRHLEVLEIQSEVNLPSVRHAVETGHADLTRPSHRKILENKWRNEGDLDLLMERIYQMNVVPDVVPTLHPSLNLRCSFKVAPPAKTPKSRAQIEAGVYLSPAQTIDPPTLYADVFHTDTRLYTLLMVDPDVPDDVNQSYQTYLHWMCPNIPLSATHRGPIHVRELVPNHTRYIPPHPQRGTPYHRYTLLLLPQPSARSGFYTLNQAAATPAGVPTSQALDIPAVKDEERLGFDVRGFVRHWGLGLGRGVGEKEGGGAFMWREVWDDAVGGIYRRFLGVEQEPVFGRFREKDRYEELREQRAKQSRYIK
ncbi:phosphatidylethanolamine-binding protein [Schizophyllum fasciatum]